jgi:hypothetical protein
MSECRIEYDRGTKDSRQRLAVLQERMAPAFPLKQQDVRPLTKSMPGETAVEIS